MSHKHRVVLMSATAIAAIAFGDIAQETCSRAPHRSAAYAQSSEFALGPGSYLNPGWQTDVIPDRDVALSGDGNGTWMAVWLEEHGDELEIVAARSQNNGKTWGWSDGIDTTVVRDMPNRITLGIGEPSGTLELATDGKGHWVLVWSEWSGRYDADIYFATYQDEDPSWSGPQILVPSMDTPEDNNPDYPITDERPRIATDQQGAWIVVWTDFDHLAFVSGGPCESIRVARSFDNGATWTEDATIATYECGMYHGPDVATDCSGNWVVVIDDTAGGHGITYAASGDVHISGEAPTWFMGVLTEGGANDPQVTAACGTNPGVFVATWTHNVPQDNRVATSSTSLDGGTTWTFPAFIAPADPPNGAAQYLVAATDGFVWTAVWAWNGFIVAHSTNNGLTWTEQSMEGVYPAPTGCFGLTGAGDDGILLAYSTSADISGLPPSGGDLDIFHSRLTVYDCSTNGIYDLIDIAEGTSTDCNDTGVPDECEAIGGGDFDADGDVDLADVVWFVDCLGGPNVPATPDDPPCQPACLDAFDQDEDNDVDLADFGGLQAAFGPL